MEWADAVSRLLDSSGGSAVLPLALVGEPAQAKTWPASHCPACGQSAENDRSPYCGGACRDRSAFIRQVRALISSAVRPDETRLAALDQVLWALLGGGYPQRLIEIPDRVHAKVLERDHHRCHACGADARSIEHLRTACNRPINLGAVCERCRKTREYGDPEFLSHPVTEAVRQELAGRILANPPARRCDDPDTWDWRSFLRER